MIDEQLEFLISQYADGTLPESERALVELRLLNSAEARQTLEMYSALDASLKSSFVLPAVDWDKLADRLSGAVAARKPGSATVLGRIGFAGRLAIAACVAIAIGSVALWTAMTPGNASIVQKSPHDGVIAPPNAPSDAPPAPLIVVRGPAPEPSDAAPVVVVSVGPSSDVMPSWRAAEGVITGPSRTIWIASTHDGAQDTQRLPY